MKSDKTPDLLPHETDTEDIIREKFWKKLIKKIPEDIKHFNINRKLSSSKKKLK